MMMIFGTSRVRQVGLNFHWSFVKWAVFFLLVLSQRYRSKHSALSVPSRRVNTAPGGGCAAWRQPRLKGVGRWCCCHNINATTNGSVGRIARLVRLYVGRDSSLEDANAGSVRAISTREEGETNNLWVLGIHHTKTRHESFKFYDDDQLVLHNRLPQLWDGRARVVGFI